MYALLSGHIVCICCLCLRKSITHVVANKADTPNMLPEYMITSKYSMWGLVSSRMCPLMNDPATSAKQENPYTIPNTPETCRGPTFKQLHRNHKEGN